MNNKGINLENVKIKNKSTIIRMLNDKGPMSRKDIANAVGLTPATVTLLCNEMINEGIIYENGDIKDERRAGRKKILIDINCDCKYVLSIYVEVKNTYIYVCDLKSNPIKKVMMKTNSQVEPGEFFKQIAEAVKLMLVDIKKNFNDILGIGIAIPGIVHRENGISKRAYGIWNEQVKIKEILESYLPCNIIVENNIKAFAQGELVYGSGRKNSNIFFLRWGPGVGASMIIDNKLYEGNDNKAMEIGHYIVDVNGQTCKCGKKGCLETKVSIKLIFEKISNIFSKESTPKLYEALDGDKELLSEENFEEWISDVDITDSSIVDKDIYNIIDQSIKEMAIAASNAITILAPDKTIIFGTMFDNPKIEELFLKYYSEYEVYYNKDSIHKSTLSKKIRYIGPTAIVVKKLFF